MTQKKYLSLCIFLLVLCNPFNSYSISIPDLNNTNSNSKLIKADETVNKSENTSISETIKGNALKEYFLNNKIEFKNKDKKIYLYNFSNNTYFLETEGKTIETGKWEISGFQQNYIEINPEDNKKYYLQKEVANENLLRFEEIINLNNFLAKVIKEGINISNNTSERYEITSSKNTSPPIILSNNNKTESSSTKSEGIVIGRDGLLSGKKKNEYTFRLNNCRAYDTQNTNFKYVNIKFAENNLDNEFNTELEFHVPGRSQKKYGTTNKIPDNFFRVATTTSNYWYKFDHNGRFIIEYHTKPSGGIFELNGYCEEIINNEKVTKVDIDYIKNTFPQKNQHVLNNKNLLSGGLATSSNKRQNTSVVSNINQNYNFRSGDNVSLRTKCYKNPAEPIVGMLVNKFLKIDQGNNHSADPACANLASGLSLEARQKMLQMGIATTSQYYFYESLIYFSESLELLFRAYDKNTEADKLKSEREYLQRGGLGTDSTKKLDAFVTNNVAVSVDISSLLQSALDLNEVGKGYYEKALPKTFEAVWSFTNFAIITVHGLEKMNTKSEQGISNILNVIGAVSTVPKLPEYAKTIYSTTKLITNGAKDKKIQDKGNHQKVIASLGF
jgi:hypothetical protein